MRTPLFFMSALVLVCLTGCGPQDRSPEFYMAQENVAEFEHALEVCKKSGLSQKEKCAAVWQAKAKMDVAQDRAMVESAIRELEGTTVVPQSPRQAPVSATAPAGKPSNAEASASNMGKPPVRN